MKIKSQFDLREVVHTYFDLNRIFHRFEQSYSIDDKTSVMLFSAYLHDKSQFSRLQFIPKFNILTCINILESTVPNLYYIELFYPIF